MEKFQTSFSFLLSSFYVCFGMLVLYAVFEVCNFDINVYYIIPCIVTLCITISCYGIVNRVGLGLSEPILILSSFLCLYTLFPSVQFFFEFKYIFINSLYQYSDFDIFIHISRFIFFNFFVVFIYFLLFDFHSNKVTRSTSDLNVVRIPLEDKPSLNLSMIILGCSILVLITLSAPVESYYDNYTRYDHLPGYLRTLVSLFKRLYWGIIPIIVVQIILRFRGSFSVMSLLIFSICLCDLIISKGSRINTFIIILQTIVVYNCVVKKVKFKSIFLLAISFVMLMALMEMLRLASNGPDLSNINIIPGEFNALFFPSIDLFHMRENDSFPSLESVMFFKDFFFVIPFFNNPDADPMNWYWINFHPNAPVAPYTMGPIADSAFYGGWFGIFVKAFLLALNLTFIRAIISHFKIGWLSLTIYSYLVSVSILALKYSVFSFQEQFLKNLLPTLLLFLFLNKLLNIFSGAISKK